MQTIPTTGPNTEKSLNAQLSAASITAMIKRQRTGHKAFFFHPFLHAIAASIIEKAKQPRIAISHLLFIIPNTGFLA